MRTDLLEEMVSEIDQWPSIETIWFFNFGEPLMHPQYRECLEILYRSPVARKANVVQHTNASLLFGNKAKAILDIPVIKQLVFSFDGFGDKESYQSIRGAHFDEVLKNIREFTLQSRNQRPGMHLTTCSILPQKGEVPDLLIPSREIAFRQLNELFHPLGVEVQIRDMHNYSGNDELDIFVNPPSIVSGGCSFVEENSLYFTVNGFTQPCCAVYNEAFNVGQFPGQSFSELLNNQQMRWLKHKLRLDEREDIPFCKSCSLSVAQLGIEGMRKYWATLDKRGEIDELSERQHIFGSVVPEPHKILRVDLGCGSNKPRGFIGIDRFPLQDVDVIADLDHTLPLKNNSVDLILASHSLEHVKDLMFTIKEIYRVCKNGAQVCIIAPYYQQGLNFANPYHKQGFNEHSPRFWTNASNTSVDPSEYIHPHAKVWGLSESDHTIPDLDFRCLRMEFFYFPEYRNISIDKQRAARKKYLDVCDQIIYHLLVVKEQISEAEMKKLVESIEYYDSPYVRIRKLEEELEKATKTLIELEQIKQKEKVLLQELDALRNSRVIRLVTRFLDRSSMWDDISPAFQQLKDDSLIFNRRLKGYALQPSINLQRVPFLHFPLQLNRKNLSGILLAPVIDFPLTGGNIGIEILSSTNSILAQATVPLDKIDTTRATQFHFPAVKDSDKGTLWLRVFVRDAGAPVRIFEFRKYKFFRLGPLITRAFCGFLFDNSQE